MTQYLISFDEGAMDHIPAGEWEDVGNDAHAVVREAVEAGVWVYGGGLERQRASIVGTDGSVTDGPYPETKEVVGGFSVVDVGLAGGGPALGGQVRQGLPVRAGGPGARRPRAGPVDDPEGDGALIQAGSRPGASNRRRSTTQRLCPVGPGRRRSRQGS